VLRPAGCASFSLYTAEDVRKVSRPGVLITSTGCPQQVWRDRVLCHKSAHSAPDKNTGSHAAPLRAPSWHAYAHAVPLHARGHAHRDRCDQECARGDPPAVQVESCRRELAGLSAYHQKCRICEVHLKAPSFERAGLLQRFCQRCGRCHELGAFEGAKRSCRAQLAKHNARCARPGPLLPPGAARARMCWAAGCALASCVVSGSTIRMKLCCCTRQVSYAQRACMCMHHCVGQQSSRQLVQARSRAPVRRIPGKGCLIGRVTKHGLCVSQAAPRARGSGGSGPHSRPQRRRARRFHDLPGAAAAGCRASEPGLRAGPAGIGRPGHRHGRARGRRRRVWRQRCLAGAGQRACCLTCP